MPVRHWNAAARLDFSEQFLTSAAIALQFVRTSSGIEESELSAALPLTVCPRSDCSSGKHSLSNTGQRPCPPAAATETVPIASHRNRIERRQIT